MSVPVSPEKPNPFPLTRAPTMKMFKREPNKRIFVNRSLMLERVKFFGFDMDYTLAVYKSPDYESLGFNLLRDRLVDIGYPEAIRDFEYDPTFPIRGLWFDKLYGTLLKIDSFGNILVCVQGFKFLKGQDILHYYPNKFVAKDANRFRIFNTLYELPTQYMLACLVDFFCNHSDYTRTKDGVKSGDLTMTFQSVYQDVQGAVDDVHAKSGPLKEETIRNVSKYVMTDERVPVLLNRMRSHGAKVFLLTNSDYRYSNAIMSYMLNDADKSRDWTSYFDYIIVDATKPLFFSEGTLLRQVNKANGHLKIGTHTGDIKTGQIYSGGSVRVFTELIGASINEVLYIGDHILGDIMKTKKKAGWRTFLIVPEINQELLVWTDKRTLFFKLEEFDCMIGELYKNLDSSSDLKPDITHIQNNIREVTHKMDMAYGMLGSLFRSGSQETFFAGQVVRYADLYAASFMNLMNYPFSYVFRAPALLMPHEATVGHEDNLVVDESVCVLRSRSSQELISPTSERRLHLKRSDSLVPNLFADTPSTLTMVQDEELCEDEDSVVPCNKKMKEKEET